MSSLSLDPFDIVLTWQMLRSTQSVCIEPLPMSATRITIVLDQRRSRPFIATTTCEPAIPSRNKELISGRSGAERDPSVRLPRCELTNVDIWHDSESGKQPATRLQMGSTTAFQPMPCTAAAILHGVRSSANRYVCEVSLARTVPSDRQPLLSHRVDKSRAALRIAAMTSFCGPS